MIGKLKFLKNNTIDARTQRLSKFFGITEEDLSLKADLSKKKSRFYSIKFASHSNNNSFSDDTSPLKELALEDKIRLKWMQPADKLPIAIDLPRLMHNIEISTWEGEIVYAREESISASNLIEQETSNGSPDLSSYRKQHTELMNQMKKRLRNFLETLAIQLGDTQTTLPALIQHFEVDGRDESNTDISVDLRNFMNGIHSI
jgi:isopenicillin N synthase-like dioxygenase